MTNNRQREKGVYSKWFARWQHGVRHRDEYSNRPILSGQHLRPGAKSDIYDCLIVHGVRTLSTYCTVDWASRRASGQKKKSVEVLVWYCGYLSAARCRLFAYGPADATAFPKPRHLLPHLNPDWFYLSGTGLPRLYWKTGAVVVVLEPSG